MLLPGDDLSQEFPDSQLLPLLSPWMRPGDAKLWRAANYRFHGLVANKWGQSRIIAQGNVGAGELFPQPSVESTHASGRLDDLTGPRIRVAIVGEVKSEEQQAYMTELAGLNGVLIKIGGAGRKERGLLEVTEESGLISLWLRSRSHIAAIVRADHYGFGLASTHADAIQLLRQLGQSLT